MKLRAFTLVLLPLLLIRIPEQPLQDELTQAMRFHRRSLGGADAIVMGLSARLSYDVKIDGRTAAARTDLLAHGGRFISERSGGERSAISFDDRLAYQFHPGSRRAYSYHGEDGNPRDRYVYNVARGEALLFPLLEANQLGAVLSLADGGERKVVVADYPDGAKRYFYLNDYYRVERDRLVYESEGLKLSVERTYSDYSSHEGAMLPGLTVVETRAEISAYGLEEKRGGRETLVLKSAEFGVDIDPGIFTRGAPSSVAGGTEVALDGDLRFACAGNPPTGDGPFQVTAAAVMGGRPLDLLAACDSGITLLPGDGSGAFPSRLGLPLVQGAALLLPARLDSGDEPDLFLAPRTPPGGVFVSIGRGRARFSAPSLIAETGPLAAAISTDLNGDSLPDVVFAAAGNGRLGILLSAGQMRFGQPVYLKTPRPILDLAAADVDGDGLTDLLAVDGADLLLFTNEGQGLLSGERTIAAGQAPVLIASGDFTGDGIVDLLASNGGPNADLGAEGLAMLAGKGSGSFEPPVYIAGASYIAAITTADFDGDGACDAACVSAANHECLVYLSRRGQLQAKGALPCGWAPCAVTAADINGDGRPDIVAANRNGDDLSVWINRFSERQ